MSRKQDSLSIFPAIIRVPSAHTLGAVIAGLLFSGCAIFRETPPTRSRFLDTDYAEIKADPGRVLAENIDRSGNDSYICGFIHFAAKEVWLSRDMKCDINETRRHEKCHYDAFTTNTKDECHDGRTF